MVNVAVHARNRAAGRLTAAVSSENGAALGWSVVAFCTFLLEHRIGTIPDLCHDLGIAPYGGSIGWVDRTRI